MLLKYTRAMGLIFTLLIPVSTALAGGDHHGALSSKQYGYNFGYQDGYQFGRDSVARGAPYNYHSEEFRYADRGYYRSLGEKDDFQHGYRDGYKQGFSDGYNGRPGRFVYGNDRSSRDYPIRLNPSDDRGEGFERNPQSYGQYRERESGNRSVADDFGYRDGRAQGEKDMIKGKPFRPSKNDRFEDADHGYQKEFGKKKLYKEEYRQAFIQGYRDAYNR